MDGPTGDKFGWFALKDFPSFYNASKVDVKFHTSSGIKNKTFIMEGLKDSTYLQYQSDRTFHPIFGDELKKIIGLAKKSKKLILPLLRRIDNKKIIEMASVMKALHHENIVDPQIGIQMANLLQGRLNVISDINTLSDTLDAF